MMPRTMPQRSRWFTRLLLAGLVAGGLAPTGAHALTVSARTSDSKLSCYKASCTESTSIELSAVDPVGADNDVTSRFVRDAGAPWYLEIADASGPVTAGTGCETQGDGTARCAVTIRPVIDELRVNTDGSRIDLGAGNDTMHLASAGCFDATVSGGAGNDAIVQDSGKDQSCSLIWDGGTGADRANGSHVIVSYADRTAPVSVTAGDGANDGEAGEGDDVGAVSSITGGAGDDTIKATMRGNGSLVGGGGNDTLTGAGNIDGGAGNDTLTGTSAENSIQGGTGDDVLRGNGGDDALNGGLDHDQLFGGSGDDSLSSLGSGLLDGGPGDDTFASSYPHGPQTFSGGPGKDAWSNGYGKSVRVTLNDRADDGPRGQRDNVLGIETVFVASGQLIGSDRSEDLRIGVGFIDGRGGDDVVRGTGLLRGGAGKDRITVEASDRAATTTIDARDGEQDRVACVQRRPRQKTVTVKRITRDANDLVLRCRAS